MTAHAGTPLSDVRLDALRRGDPAAQERLLAEWLPVVVSWCNRLGGAAVDAEDAAHDVFLVVLRRLDTLQSEAQLPAWLFGITRRVLAQHRRRAWIKRWVPGLKAEPVERTGPARLAEVSQTAWQVQQALEKLPEAEREVLVLCVLEDRTDKEVSEMLEMPIGTVKSRLRRAREHFHEIASAMGLGEAV